MPQDIYSVERWYAPNSPNGERWERVTRVSNIQEAKRLVAYLQARDSSAFYSCFPDGQEVYASADEFLMALGESKVG